MQKDRNSRLFLLICFGLGIVAEISFFHGEIGVSYPVFIAAFYAVLYYRFGFKFFHRRIGLLLMVMIWILSATYLFYDNEVFYVFNILVIPVLVFVHIVLITTPNHVDWISAPFFHRIMQKFTQTFGYGKRLTKLLFKRTLFRKVNKETAQTIKRIVIGLLIGVPLLLFITALLVLADANFGEVIMKVPNFVLKLNFVEGVFRAIVVLLCTLLFFGAFQVLYKRHIPPVVRPTTKKEAQWDSVIAATILVLLNGIYLLFVVIQFAYFFGDALQENFTYAEYARRGFFELVLVTLINWSLLLICLNLVKVKTRGMGYFMKILYSLLIVSSGVMLASAYMRLSMYEEAYGFTMDRIFAHAFMLFLIIIFAYTFIRVWLEGISILHFYIIAGLLFYTALNTVNLEGMVVANNLERFDETGKIDIYYLNQLSYSGINGLIALYEKDPDYPELQVILQDRKQMLDYLELDHWQSFNFKKQQVVKKLQELDLN